MTSHNHESEDSDLGRYGAAEADLSAVRHTLRRAGRGEADAVELERALRGYWLEHGPTLRRAGAAVGEAVRQQALAQLYEWRRRLAEQLQAHADQPDLQPDKDS
ncbi:hypothetical protein [Kribbella sp. NPDC050470]|uniref:hypothetical protein n=1 Tax=unclassified Kribbella TaxID=2644121 RepID=UPI0037933B9A